ncbi:hypothetical protein GCM10023185_15890 [Hymenobacter saemangeumensis]|uniref:Uncharacterized protein n=1 Tax=Hymenobacter saemangeumensis TaxID=1084522 RepID=A0ABP8I9I9_9BACT
MKGLFALGLGLLSVCLLSGCLAVRETKRWDFVQLNERGTRPFIDITVERPGFYMPVPPVLWEVRTDKHYRLRLDINTGKDVRYDRLDSVAYRLWGAAPQVLAAGTFPVANGAFGRPRHLLAAEFPNVHLVRGQSPARILLPHSKQALKGTFMFYLTDTARSAQVIRLDSVTMRYRKRRFGSFL